MHSWPQLTALLTERSRSNPKVKMLAPRWVIGPCLTSRRKSRRLRAHGADNRLLAGLTRLCAEILPREVVGSTGPRMSMPSGT